MPYPRALVPRAVTQRLPAFFPTRVRIESPVTTKNPANGEMEVTGWGTVYDDVPAAVSPVIRLGEEWRNWRLEYVYEQVTHRAQLDGYYPDIKASHRMVDVKTGVVHNISAAHASSHLRLTRIMSRVVDPQAVEGL